MTSAGTVGTDGPTDAAGALVDGGTIYTIEEAVKVEVDLLGRKEAFLANDIYIYSFGHGSKLEFLQYDLILLGPMPPICAYFWVKLANRIKSIIYRFVQC